MLLDEAADVLRIEAEAILNLIPRLDSRFERLVDLIYTSVGRVIVSGIGKSGLIGRKIAATLNSTGTHAFFLHPVEAMHGDLGMVCKEDIFIALSHSGESEELNILIPSIKSSGCPVISFTGNTDSTLARMSDLVIDVGIEKEACPMGLAPTTSTTALLAMGDALSVVLINKKGFKASDFRKFHPGGKLGQRLALNVGEIMIKDDKIPKIHESERLYDAITIIDQKRLGIVLVVDHDNILKGVLTDGDIRHLTATGKLSHDLIVSQVMTSNPKRLSSGMAAYDALNIMEEHQITVLPVIEENGVVIGILHLHDILGKGQFKFTGK